MGEGKGAGSAPRTASPTTLQTGLQSLTKGLLRFWTVDIHRERSRQDTGRWWGLGLGTRRGEGMPHPGGVRPSSSWLPEPLGRGRHKPQAQPSLRFCGTLEGWNLAQRRHAPYRAAGSLSSVDGESSASPSPQRGGTSNLNKSQPVSGRKLGTEEAGKQAK